MWHRASKCSPAGKLRTDLTKDAPQKPFPWPKEPKARGSIPGWMNIVAFRNGVRICIPWQWPNTAASCIPGRVLLCFLFFFFMKNYVFYIPDMFQLLGSLYFHAQAVPFYPSGGLSRWLSVLLRRSPWPSTTFFFSGTKDALSLTCNFPAPKLKAVVSPKGLILFVATGI